MLTLEIVLVVLVLVVFVVALVVALAVLAVSVIFFNGSVADGVGVSVGGGGVGVWAFLPDPLLPSYAAIPGLVRGRPSVLAERRSVFSGGRVAAECAPSAAMLLDLLGANGSVTEHM